MKLSEAILIVARQEVGVTEDGTSNRGKRVDEYQRATWLEEKDWGAWCAAFVCWVVREAMVMAKIKETDGFKRPQTGRAYDMEKWSLAQDSSTATRKPCGADIRPADIIVFTFSHTGFALTAPDEDGWLVTIEGNSNAKGSRTGGMVCIGHRHISQIRSRIRFTI
jgi:hypothetical protein